MNANTRESFLTTYEHLCALIFRGYELAAEKLCWPSLRSENAAATLSDRNPTASTACGRVRR
jgi:hypothetical protein